MPSDFEKAEAVTILIAEDDPDDRLIIKVALDAEGVSNPLHFVGDGEELMDYLEKDRIFDKRSPRHVLILDLNMPKKDGRAALLEIRQDPILRHLTVIVLSTSNAEHDYEYCSRLGISDYITKPDSFDGFIHLARRINQLCSAS